MPKECDARGLVSLLTEKGLHISAAESCTGGLFCARIVDVPDASKVLDAGYITYANAAKVRLGVEQKTLDEFGAVSEQVAGQMAEAAAKAAGADIGVGISGIAGPGGGSAAKPVGTVCFGFYICGRVFTDTRHFTGADRTGVREASVRYCLERVAGLVKGYCKKD